VNIVSDYRTTGVRSLAQAKHFPLASVCRLALIFLDLDFIYGVRLRL
jgi:hypothetical protein